MTLEEAKEQFRGEKVWQESRLAGMERCGVKELLETYPELASAFKELNAEAKLAVFMEVLATLDKVE